MSLLSSPILFYAGSVLLGLLLGWAFVVLWRFCVPPGETRRVMSELLAVAREMTRSDEVGQFLGLYKRLFLSLGRYLARNFAGLALTCAPMVLVWILLVPPVLDAWGNQAPGVASFPEAHDPAVVAPSYEPPRRLAICAEAGYCPLFALLGFETRETVDVRLKEDAPFVLLRPTHGDGNPLWPYLSDLEFVFFCTFMLTAVASFLLLRKRR